MIGKPEKGRMVENMLLRMAQSGQIVNKLGEDELIGLLEQVNSQMQSQERKTTVKVNWLPLTTQIFEGLLLKYSRSHCAGLMFFSSLTEEELLWMILTTMMITNIIQL